jgi:hypothetical protein
MMCGENEPPIRVYRFENDGMGGPTEDSIDAILEDVRERNLKDGHIRCMEAVNRSR